MLFGQQPKRASEREISSLVLITNVHSLDLEAVSSQTHLVDLAGLQSRELCYQADEEGLHVVVHVQMFEEVDEEGLRARLDVFVKLKCGHSCGETFFVWFFRFLRLQAAITALVLVIHLVCRQHRLRLSSIVNLRLLIVRIFDLSVTIEQKISH